MGLNEMRLGQMLPNNKIWQIQNFEMGGAE